MISIPLGTVVHDKDGKKYVYFGYKVTKVKTRSHYFILERRSQDNHPPFYWRYNAVEEEKLIAKFPDLAQHITYEREYI